MKSLLLSEETDRLCRSIIMNHSQRLNKLYSIEMSIEVSIDVSWVLMMYIVYYRVCNT